MRPPLAAVVEGLFRRAFRPLAGPLGAVDDQRPGAAGRPGRGRGIGEAAGVPLRADAQVVQRRQQHGQEPVDPVVHGRLAQPEQFAHEHLERVRLQVDQDEQQLLLRAAQDRPAAPAGLPKAGSARRRPVGATPPPICPREAAQQQVELGERQPREGKELAAVVSESRAGQHPPSYARNPYFR